MLKTIITKQAYGQMRKVIILMSTGYAHVRDVPSSGCRCVTRMDLELLNSLESLLLVAGVDHSSRAIRRVIAGLDFRVGAVSRRETEWKAKRPAWSEATREIQTPLHPRTFQNLVTKAEAKKSCDIDSFLTPATDFAVL